LGDRKNQYPKTQKIQNKLNQPNEENEL